MPNSSNNSVAGKLKDALCAWLQRVENDAAAVQREVCTGGGAVGRMEARLRDYFGMPHCLLMNNATNAWLAAVLARASQWRGAEIIVPPRSWGSTYAAFEHIGCRLMVAPARRDGNVDARALHGLVTPNVRAVIGTDFRGAPHDMFALRRFADDHGIAYWSDAASSFGVRYRGRPASSLADVVAVSFGPAKRVSWGEGGALLTRDAALYETLVRETQHPRRYRREFSLSGETDRQILNGRIHPLAAVMGEILMEGMVPGCGGTTP